MNPLSLFQKYKLSRVSTDFECLFILPILQLLN